MQNFLLLFSILLLVSCRNNSNTQVTEEKPSTKKNLIAIQTAFKTTAGIDGPLTTDSVTLRKNINALYKRAVAGNFSTQYAVLTDLELHSGSKRMYLVKLSSKTVLKKALVTHGSSTTYLPNGQRLYSNVEGSLCSSLGMYRIGNAYQGSFGLAYKLYGLDAENSNAYARAIVLHSHSCVPDEETEDPICQSWGCPTVSPAFLKILAGIIDVSQKPVLLYIFDSSKK